MLVGREPLQAAATVVGVGVVVGEGVGVARGLTIGTGSAGAGFGVVADGDVAATDTRPAPAQLLVSERSLIRLSASAQARTSYWPPAALEGTAKLNRTTALRLWASALVAETMRGVHGP